VPYTLLHLHPGADAADIVARTPGLHQQHRTTLLTLLPQTCCLRLPQACWRFAALNQIQSPCPPPFVSRTPQAIASRLPPCR
jgi:hypothetical protein